MVFTGEEFAKMDKVVSNQIYCDAKPAVRSAIVYQHASTIWPTSTVDDVAMRTLGPWAISMLKTEGGREEWAEWRKRAIKAAITIGCAAMLYAGRLYQWKCDILMDMRYREGDLQVDDNVYWTEQDDDLRTRESSMRARGVEHARIIKRFPRERIRHFYHRDTAFDDRIDDLRAVRDWFWDVPREIMHKIVEATTDNAEVLTMRILDRHYYNRWLRMTSNFRIYTTFGVGATVVILGVAACFRSTCPTAHFELNSTSYGTSEPNEPGDHFGPGGLGEDSGDHFGPEHEEAGSGGPKRNALGFVEPGGGNDDHHPLGSATADDAEIRAMRDDRCLYKDCGAGIVGQSTVPENPKKIVGVIALPTSVPQNKYNIL